MVSNPFQEGVSVQVTGDASDLNQTIDGVIGKLGNMQKAVGAAGAALGALAVGGLAKSASAAADFEQSLADLEKVTDAQTAEELSEPIQEMAAELPLAAEEVANLAAQAGRFGAEGAEEIEAFTRTASEMGAATTLSADEAGRSLAKVATALDEPLENVDRLGDSINSLSNDMQTDSAEIVDAAQRGGFAISEMGLNSSEVLSLSAALNEVAPSSRRAGNMLKQMGESIQNPDNIQAFAEATNMTVEEFKNLREENPKRALLAVAEAMKENESASQTLSESLSKQQVRAFQRASQQTDTFREAMETSNQAMEEGGSLSREVAIETDTLQGKWQLLQSQLNNIARDIGETLTPALTVLLDKVSAAVSAFSDFNSRTEGLAGTIGLLTVGATGAVAAIGAFGNALVASSAASAAASGALGALSTVVGALSAPILAAAAAAGTLYFAWKTNFGGIRTITQRTLGEISRLFHLHFGEYTDEVRSAMQTIRQTVQTVQSTIEGLWSSHGETVQATVSAVFDALGVIVTGGMDTLFGTVKATLQILTGDWSGAWDTMAGVTDRNLSRITGFVDRWNIISRVRSKLSGLESTTRSAFTNAKEAALSPFRDLERVITNVLDAIEARIDAVMNRIESAKESAGNLGGGAKDKATGAVDKAGDAVGGVVSSLDTGGKLASDGLYMGHEGERVLNPAETKQLEKLTEKGGGTQTVKLVVEEDTDLTNARIENGAEMVIERKERRTHRNTGRNPSPR